jgi:beta-mannosidase
VEFNYRLALMAHQIAVLFGSVPEELDAFIAGSQLSQAEALKYFIERFRIGKGRRTGILWWNVRDGWPQISDGIVDYYGSAKAAYPVIRRVQQDICIMLDEPVDSFHEVVAVNDTLEPALLSVLILDGDRPLLAGEFTVPANGRLSLGRVSEAPGQTFYSIVWDCGGKSFKNHYLAGPRPFDLAQCRQWYGQEGLLSTAEGGARNVEGAEHQSGMVDRESREWTRMTDVLFSGVSLGR